LHTWTPATVSEKVLMLEESKLGALHRARLVESATHGSVWPAAAERFFGLRVWPRACTHARAFLRNIDSEWCCCAPERCSGCECEGNKQRLSANGIAFAQSASSAARARKGR
jgi:hypothetical protein